MENELLSGIEELELLFEELLETSPHKTAAVFSDGLFGVVPLRSNIITFPEEGKQYYNSYSNSKLLPRTDIFKSQEDAQLFLGKLENLNWGYSYWELVNMSWNNQNSAKTVAVVHWDASSIGHTSVYDHDCGDVPIMEVRNGRMIVYD